jgi:hypothetical protein
VDVLLELLLLLLLDGSNLSLLSNVGAKTSDFFVVLLSDFIMRAFEVVKRLSDQVEF